MNGKGGAFINAADEEDGGRGGVLDEAAERQAFMEAVAEWRRADVAGPKQPLVIEREYLTGKKKSETADDSGDMWKNPFAPPAAAADSSDRRKVSYIL